MRALAPKLVTVLALLSINNFTLGCGKKDSYKPPQGMPAPGPAPAPVPGPGGDQENLEANTLQPSSYAIQIVNAASLNKIAADATDNPEFYAIAGQLVARAQAPDKVKGGAIACMSRLRGAQANSGETLIVTHLNTSAQDKSSNQHWVNFTSINADSKKAVAILCIKANSPVTLAEANAALAGHVQITKKN